MAKPTVEVALKSACSSVGEGPHWDAASQSLLFVDIKSLDVHRFNTLTGEDQVRHLKDTVSLVVPRRAGGYVVGLGRRLSVLEWDSGMISTVQEVEPDRGTRFNDGKCDAKGRLWQNSCLPKLVFLDYLHGTMGPEMGNARVDPEAGSLYCLHTDRSISRHVQNVNISNAWAWSQDNRTMFYIDSTPRKVFAYDFDLETGAMSNKRTAVQFEPDTLSTYGFPDGMTIDTEGKLWVACYNAGAVYKFDPETGKTLQKIDIPAKQTTSVCWGGKDLDELYVTCARVYLSEEEFRATQPLAGSVFKVTGTGAKGLPAYVYEG